jgi:hypothetical protein
VRPFGEKKVGKDQVTVNFDDVEKKLIQPALSDLKIAGSTTAEILESGNIRHSMYQLLLLAELVIADLSIDNANVFYELGIRHALREKRTFLLNSRPANEPMPFDVLTDRYLAYDHTKPEASRAALVGRAAAYAGLGFEGQPRLQHVAVAALAGSGQVHGRAAGFSQ